MSASEAKTDDIPFEAVRFDGPNVKFTFRVYWPQVGTFLDGEAKTWANFAKVVAPLVAGGFIIVDVQAVVDVTDYMVAQIAAATETWRRDNEKAGEGTGARPAGQAGSGGGTKTERPTEG